MSDPAGSAGGAHLPAVGALLQRPEMVALVADHGHEAVAQVLRQVLGEERSRRSHSEHLASEAEVAAQAAVLLAQSPRRLRRVINGTGVIVHTNLGRAPIAREAALRAAELASGYSNLELEMASGRRGDRQELLSPLLLQLSGAEAALVVNNGAAAILLALSGLFRSKEVVVSRGEAIEIGGGFRIPEILRLSGARLVDVGTTNRTRVSDYLTATTARTGAYLRVHHSNFRMEGYVSRPELSALARAAHERGIVLVEDLGSGLLPPAPPPLTAEERVRESIAAGVDLVIFSGDKLVGASQAGLIVGRADLVGRLRRYPLARALRPDKFQLAVLEETLLLHANPGRIDEIPVWRMIREDPGTLRRRAEGWAQFLQERGVPAEAVALASAVGGGTSPGPTIPSAGILLATSAGAALRSRLLGGEPPVVALERDQGVLIDARTVLPDEDQQLLQAILRAVPDGPADE